MVKFAIRWTQGLLQIHSHGANNKPHLISLKEQDVATVKLGSTQGMLKVASEAFWAEAFHPGASSIRPETMQAQLPCMVRVWWIFAP